MGPELSPNPIPERVCETDFGGVPITSGGGFSAVWPQPDYQKVRDFPLFASTLYRAIYSL